MDGRADSYPLSARGQIVEMQPETGVLQATVGNIHAGDLFKGAVLQQRADQLSFSATKIGDSLGACRP
jgi:hypothetical protein